MKFIALVLCMALLTTSAQPAFAKGTGTLADLNIWHSYGGKLKKFLEKELEKQSTENKHGCHYSVQAYVGTDVNRCCARFMLDQKDDKLGNLTEQVKPYCDMLTMSDMTCDYANDMYWLWLSSVVSGVVETIAEQKEAIYTKQMQEKVDQLTSEAQASGMTYDAAVNQRNWASGQGTSDWWRLCMPVYSILKSNEMKALRESISKSSETNFASLKAIISPAPGAPVNPTSGPLALGSISGSSGSGGSSGLSESAIDYSTQSMAKETAAKAAFNAATADSFREPGQMNSPGQQKFNAAAAKLKDVGVDPKTFFDDLEKSGIMAAIEKNLGSKLDPAYLDQLKAADKKSSAPIMPSLAYESGKPGFSKAKKDTGAALDLFARNPAGEGGLKEVKFGTELSNDIWHSGTKLSIFEIVTKKTSDVASRVQ